MNIVRHVIWFYKFSTEDTQQVQLEPSQFEGEATDYFVTTKSDNKELEQVFQICLEESEWAPDEPKWGTLLPPSCSNWVHWMIWGASALLKILEKIATIGTYRTSKPELWPSPKTPATRKAKKLCLDSLPAVKKIEILWQVENGIASAKPRKSFSKKSNPENKTAAPRLLQQLAPAVGLLTIRIQFQGHFFLQQSGPRQINAPSKNCNHFQAGYFDGDCKQPPALAIPWNHKYCDWIMLKRKPNVVYENSSKWSSLLCKMRLIGPFGSTCIFKNLVKSKSHLTTV